jgi:hypothetical protein
MKEVIKDFFL